MTTCPAGHDSASTDFCDACGIRIGGSAQTQADAATAAAPPDPLAEPCPQCGNARSGQFCEACGFDFGSGQASRHVASAAPAAGPGDGAAPRPVSPAAWTAVVAADRAYYDNVVAAGGPDSGAVQFPGYCAERRFPLTGPQMRVGRHSASRGLQPEIDLTGPPADPGVSRLHAVLIAEPDGSWAILDPGSENGTLVNGSEIATGARIPLHDGDRIHLGAWTLLTIQGGP
jgi:hypothetical protein